jgi:glycine betaine/proline transport system ATP-binding protein
MLATAADGDVTVVAPSGEPMGLVTFRQLACAMVNSEKDAETSSSPLVAAL